MKNDTEIPAVYEGYWLPRETVLHGRYRIQDVIAEGGMGIVYLGYDPVLETKVSIKEYFPRRYGMRIPGQTSLQIYAGSSAELFRTELEKFIKEARTLARFGALDSIVSVKDFFYENETGYMVMEYVEGETVKQLVEREGKMEPQHVLRLMKPVLDCLAVIHQEKLLHRDIAPDNLILREDGRLVLIDFGTARFLSADDEQTMTIYYKSGYSAGEQYAPHTEKGPYTDVYGICTTMYFMLTGVSPEESVRRILHDRVVPLSKYRDIDLPDSAKNAIVKGMEVDILKRYADVDQLCKDLYRNVDIVNGELQKSRKNKWNVSRRGLVGILILLVIGAGVYGNRMNERDGQDFMKDRAMGPDITGIAATSALGTSSMPVPSSTPVLSEAISSTKQPSEIKKPEKAETSTKRKSIKAKKAGVTVTQNPTAPKSAASNRKRSSGKSAKSSEKTVVTSRPKTTSAPRNGNSSKTGSSDQKSFAGKLPKATKESFAGQLP